MIIIVAGGEFTRDILLEAHELGMGNGEYTFIGIELIRNTASFGDFSWYRPGDRRNKEAKEMFHALMMIAVRVPTSPEYASFTHTVAKTSQEEFGVNLSESDVRIM